MIIPVRVPADARVHQVGGLRRLTEDHPLFRVLCPVCDHELGGEPVTLVYVGVEADSRKSAGWMTGAAVAVHIRCTHDPAASDHDQEAVPT